MNTSSITVYKSSSYGSLPTPSRSYYTFEGWYTSESGGTKIVSSSIVTSDVDHTLYAHWKLNSNIVSTGKCGKNATYVLDTNGVYTIDGKGALFNGRGSIHGDDPSIYLKVKKIVIHNGITDTGNSRFDEFTNLTSVSLPNTLITIGPGTFSRCTSLKTIFIPNSVKTIDVGAFSSSGLTSVNIPQSVTKIDAGAFSGCTALSSLSIPDSVTYIGRCAFWDWSSSQTIYMKGRNTASTSWSEEWNRNCRAKIIWNA